MSETNPDKSERTATLFALSTATIMIAQQVAGKATRDALFLSHFDVTQLPKVIIAAAILSMAAVLVTSKLLAKFGPAGLVPAAFGLSAVLFAGEWVLFDLKPQFAAVVLYLHMAIFGAILISGVWSVVNERFDPHSAKRTIARVAGAATLGGLLGGLLAERVSSLIDVRAMLLVLAGLHLLCVLGVRGIGAPSRRGNEPATPSTGGLQIIARTPYLQQMGLLMVLLALVAVLVDYAFKAEASARFASSEQLVSFFATFYAGVGIIAFLVQTTLGPRLLQRFGIGTTIAVLPVMVLAGALFGAAITRLWTMVILRGTQAVLTNSFHRSAFELLYTPILPEQKRPTKTIIDVASDRLGDMLGGGLILLLLATFTSLPIALVLVLAAIAAACALYLVTRLHRGYVAQLASSLRKGSVSLDEEDVMDATTQHILAETNVYTERELLMAKIKEHREARHAGRPESEDPPTSDLLPEDVKTIETGMPGVLPNRNRRSKDHDLLVMTMTDLTSNDIPRIRHGLRSTFMDVRLTPYLISLLGEHEVAEDARMELRWLVPRIIGQLTDALLDPDQPLLVRQRLPSVLEVCHNPRAVRALVDGLKDPEFNVRYACGRTLARMTARNDQIQILKETVFEVVRQEVDVSNEVWSGRTLKIDTALPVDAVHDVTTELPRVNRSIEHVFTVLSLCLDHDALHLALHAVHSKDRNLRGTALEYLENVLPDDIRIDLWRHIGVTRPRPKSTRSHNVLVGELKQIHGRSR